MMILQIMMILFSGARLTQEILMHKGGKTTWKVLELNALRSI
jgi:hypothetical protein